MISGAGIKGYSTLPLSPLFSLFLLCHHSISFFFLLHCTLLHSTLLLSTPLYSSLLYSTLLYSTLLYSTLLYSTLLYSTLLYSTPHFCFCPKYFMFITTHNVRCRPHQCDYSGRNAVMIAAEHGHTAIVAVLITAGAVNVESFTIFPLLTFSHPFLYLSFSVLFIHYLNLLSSVYGFFNCYIL